jgi:hypothetical protein
VSGVAKMRDDCGDAIVIENSKTWGANPGPRVIVSFANPNDEDGRTTDMCFTEAQLRTFIELLQSAGEEAFT